jgi:GNAT superfamily N-acetyltransferase
MRPAESYLVNPEVGNETLNALFATAWPHHGERDFGPILARSLCYVCAYWKGELIGFVNLAWDGGCHAFLLDTTVHPSHRRQGIGQQLVMQAVAVARARGVEWVHVDFEPHLRSFYAACGFQPTGAGLIHCGDSNQE